MISKSIDFAIHTGDIILRVNPVLKFRVFSAAGGYSPRIAQANPVNCTHGVPQVIIARLILFIAVSIIDFTLLFYLSSDVGDTIF